MMRSTTPTTSQTRRPSGRRRPPSVVGTRITRSLRQAVSLFVALATRLAYCPRLLRCCGRRENLGRREQTLTARVRGRERLTGRERLALHRGLEPVVVAVGAATGIDRHPPEHRTLGHRVVDT